MTHELVAVEVTYSGRVQGVGFRATCVELAAGRKVTGWVKNLPDGRVELVAEGERSVVEAFLAAIRSRFAGHFRGEPAVHSRELTGNLTPFRVIG